MRCDVLGASGHVTIKLSICNRGAFYKSGVYAVKVKCLTPGGLHCVEGTTDFGAIRSDRSAEVSRRHTTAWMQEPEQRRSSCRAGGLAAEGLNKSRKVIVGEVVSDGIC